uniref:Uncharacterized protein n=1 Tax=Wuchereria bancrofti TaxID=6293 RepID=A0AAF5Q6Q5_WUCBA
MDPEEKEKSVRKEKENGKGEGKSRTGKEQESEKKEKEKEERNERSNKIRSEIEVISKTRNKVGVQELKDGTKFRLGRFGAQFFAPVTNEPSG